MRGKTRLIIGLSGASGVVYGVRLLEMLLPMEVETHLVITRAAEVTLAHETDLKLQDVRDLADEVHGIGDLAAPISSGSFKTLGMIVAPCSIKSAAEIACGATSTLLSRAADVTLKERRKLVLLVRESPLSDIHLENMLKLSRMGVVIFPPVPAFYNHPQSLDEMVNHVAMRALDQFDLHLDVMRRWDGTNTTPKSRATN